MGVVIKNNAASFLSAGVSNVDSTLTVQDAASFPVLGVDEYMYLTLQDANNPSIFEIVKVTDTAGNVFTVERGLQGTNALAFVQDDLVELRLTVGTLDDRYINADEITNADSISDTDSINKFGKIPLLVNDAVVTAGEFQLNLSHNLCDIKVTSATQDITIKLPNDATTSQFTCRVFNKTSLYFNVILAKHDGTVLDTIGRDDSCESFINKDAVPAINSWSLITQKRNEIPELDTAIFGDFNNPIYQTLFVERFLLKGTGSSFSNKPPNFPLNSALASGTVLCTITNTDGFYEQRIQVDNTHSPNSLYRSSIFFRIVDDVSLLFSAPWASFALNSRIDFVLNIIDGKVDKSTQVLAGNGMVGGGDLSADVTVSHAPTSTESSHNNTGASVIQSVEIDSFGHVTSLSSVQLRLQDLSGTASDSALLNGAPASSYVSSIAVQNIAGEKTFEDGISVINGSHLHFGGTVATTHDFAVYSVLGNLRIEQQAVATGKSLLLTDRTGVNLWDFDFDDKFLRHSDGVASTFGSSDDLRIFHTGTGGGKSNVHGYNSDIVFRAASVGNELLFETKTDADVVQTVFSTLGGAASSFSARYNDIEVLKTIVDGISIGDDGYLKLQQKVSSCDIFSDGGDLNIYNNVVSKNLSLGVRNTDGSYDFPLQIFAGSSDDSSSILLRHGDKSSLSTSALGCIVYGLINDDNGVPFVKNNTHTNPVSVTLKGSFVKEGSNRHVVNITSGNSSVTLDEVTFVVGDEIVVNRLYESAGTIEVITDEGSIFYNGVDVSSVHAGGKAVTMNSGKFTVIFRKIDLVNWVISFLPV